MRVTRSDAVRQTQSAPPDAKKAPAKRPVAAAAAVAAADNAPAPVSPGLSGGGVVGLGGALSVATMLSRDGRNPDLANGLDQTYYGSNYLIRRVLELVALYDDPLWSFFARVEALTREKSIRTTALFGTAAVNELFSGVSMDTDRFFHRMPGTVLDKERKANNYGPLARDLVDTRAPTGDAKRVATGAGNYPVVGKIGDPVGDDDDDSTPAEVYFGSSSPSNPAGGSNPLPPSGGGGPPPPVSAPSSVSSAARPDADGASVHLSRIVASNARAGKSSFDIAADPKSGLVDPADREVGDRSVKMDPRALGANPAVLKSTAEPTEDGQVAAKVRNTGSNIIINLPDGREQPVYNIEDGDVVAARRLLGGATMSDADERVWRTIYHGGVGVTTPAPRQTTAELNAARQNQRQQIVQYASSVRDPADLHWKLLPEHLRVLFLTNEAAAALEHAVWFAHYQQPWDGETPAALQNTAVLRPRQIVPAIDLMTHEMVRVPFQALVANIILYWRTRRAADKSRVDEALSAINGVILTLSTMRESASGFVSLLGHYDVEARRSRFEIERSRAVYLQQTGNHWSDMDRVFYSGAVAPGVPMSGRVGALARSTAMATQVPGISPAESAALYTSLANASPGTSPIATLQDVRFRAGFAAAVLGSGRRF